MENKNLKNPSGCDIILSRTQKNFLAYCKQLGYGKLEVIIKDGEPVLAVKKEELIKFD